LIFTIAPAFPKFLFQKVKRVTTWQIVLFLQAGLSIAPQNEGDDDSPGRPGQLIKKYTKTNGGVWF
jgi:hypothetical protein